ncbi:hypothetical protein MAR_020595, partial [Mya arenaria]
MSDLIACRADKSSISFCKTLSVTDRGNILNELTNQQLVDRYRFNRAGLNYLETVFGPALEPATMRHKSLSAMDKLLITLRVALGTYLMKVTYLMVNTIFLGTADMLGEGGYLPHTSIPSLVAKQHTT